MIKPIFSVLAHAEKQFFSKLVFEYGQTDIDHLFTTVILPKISYGLSVYAASSPEITTVQNFFRHCFKRSYVSYPIDIYDLVEKPDYAIFDKARNSVRHPLHELLPKVKSTTHSLRKVGSLLPKVNTERFKKCFIDSRSILSTN